MEYLKLSQQVMQGELNPLATYIDLKRSLDECSEAIKQIQDLAIDEALKYPEKSFKLNGAMIEKRNSLATWDYSNCQPYKEAKERLKYIEQLAQIGGMDESGNEVPKAVRIEGRQSIAVKLLKS